MHYWNNWLLEYLNNGSQSVTDQNILSHILSAEEGTATLSLFAAHRYNNILGHVRQISRAFRANDFFPTVPDEMDLCIEIWK